MNNKWLSIVLLVVAVALLFCTLQFYGSLIAFELPYGYTERLVEFGGFGSAISLLFILFSTKKINRSPLAKWTIRVNILSLMNIIIVWIIAIFLILADGPIRIGP